MSEQWIVRVQGNEYGPVDLDELRQWKLEGRLIRDNEVRAADDERWIKAGELPEIFSDEPAPAEPPELPPLPMGRASLGQIFSTGWRIYRQGFGRFFLLSLLVSVPSFFLQMAAPFLEMPKEQGPMGMVIASATVVFLMLALLVIAWPFSIAATQLLAADLYAGQGVSSARALLTRAKPLWTRVFTVGLIVYASYLLWTILPLVLAFSLVGGAGSGGGLLLAFLLLLFTAYMVARLFINFLFWQQSASFNELPAVNALQESKDLARSGKELPRSQRPLYRGALIASLWLLALIVLNLALEMPAVPFKMRGVTSIEQATTMLQAMASQNTPDFLSGLTTFLSCLINAILRPWLAALFVVLYFETKATSKV